MTSRFRRSAEHFAVIVLFLSLGAYRFRAALAGATAALPGDGWGTIGWIYDLTANIEQNGLSHLWGDTYFTDGFGGGLNTFGAPGSFFWRIPEWLLGMVLSSENVYDAIALIGFALIGWAGFLAGRQLSLPRPLALLAGVMLCSMENFDWRVQGHLTLAVYFMPVFLIYGALRYYNRPTMPHWLLLIGLAWLNFAANEYYGYFGIYMVAVVFAASLWEERRRGERPLLAPHVLKIALGGTVFLVLMMVTYPNLVLGKVLGLFSKSVDTGSQYSKDHREFMAHSLNSVYEVLVPAVDWVRAFTPEVIINTPRQAEFTFRIGFLIPVVAVFGAIVMYFFRRKFQRFSSRYFILLSLFTAVAYSLACRPTKTLSLGRLTQVIGPMFRIGLRALLYADISLILGFCLVLAFSWNLVRSRSTKWLPATLAALVISFLGASALAELRKGDPMQVFESIGTSELPRSSAYEKLANEDYGYLLELPFHVPGQNIQEDDYNYYLNRRIHKKPLINGLPFSGDLEMTLRRMHDRWSPNSPGPALIQKLQALGVPYLAVHTTKGVDVEPLAKAQGLTKIIDEDGIQIFRISTSAPFSVALLRKEVWPSTYTFPVESLPTATPESSIVEDPFGGPAKLRHLNYQGPFPATLSFGPYLPLERGQYEATIALAGQTFGNPADTLVELAIVSTKGENLKVNVMGNELESGKLTLFRIPFHFKMPSDVQVIVRVLGASDIYHGPLTINRFDSSGNLATGVLYGHEAAMR